MDPIRTLLKWPGGKAREIRHIEGLVPPFRRYIEPFLGGGAMFFYLRPRRAVLNDLSPDLMAFYRLVQAQDRRFREDLDAYDALWGALLSACDERAGRILDLYVRVRGRGGLSEEEERETAALSEEIAYALHRVGADGPIPDRERYAARTAESVRDKMLRTMRNEAKAPFTEEDLKENLVTGFAGGAYLYFREVYNDFLTGAKSPPDEAYRTAVFYFIREYCYGSMFRYDRRGRFNIPYGGMTYDRKRLRPKIDRIFSPETEELFRGAELWRMDFEEALDRARPDGDDFLFLDPPYDTEFSDYEGRSFTMDDQRRLAEALKRTRGRFLLIIKDTEQIRALYEGWSQIRSFRKKYAYNVRGRNDRDTEHLIVTDRSV